MAIRLRGSSETARRIRELPLRQFRPGERFRYWNEDATHSTDGTLMRITSCSATVLLDGVKKEHTFNTGDGRQVTFKEKNEPQHWAPSTPVERLDEPRVDVGAILNANQARFTKQQEQRAKQMKINYEEEYEMVALPGVGGKVIKMKKSAAKKARAKAAAKPLNDCLCGCGEKVTGRFRMGHDGRFYGWLKRIVSGDPKRIAEVPAKFRSRWNAASARAEIKRSGH